MKSLKITGLFAFGLVLLTSCASVANIEKDETINFSNYKSYAWVDEKQDSISYKPSGIQEQNLHAAVGNQLAKAEWKEGKNSPDILLKHDLLVEKTIKESRNPVYSRSYTRPYYNPYSHRWNYLYYPSQLMGYDSRQYQVKEGTLTITMIDAKTDKVVWQGWTTDELKSNNLTSKELESSVKNIFRKFDVAKN